jgi:hypothetical protein
MVENSIPSKKIEQVEPKLEDWKEWRLEGDPPPKWWATNPLTRQPCLIYRSYEDYCMD